MHNLHQLYLNCLKFLTLLVLLVYLFLYQNLLKYLKAGQDVSDRHIHRHVMARQLRQRREAFRSDEAARMDAELVHERGFREGVQGVLVVLLEDRFGELPDEAVDAIRATHHVDDLQACLDRLPEAASWQAVLQAHETAT